MNILILEDNKNRNIIFRRNLIGHAVTITDDVRELKNHLLSQEWDVLFLDHDLGGEVYVDSGREDTGCEAARWLHNNPNRVPEIIFIHSLNENGSKEIKKLVPSAVYSPGIWVDLDIDIIGNHEYKCSHDKLAKHQTERLSMYGRY
jgi:CheY-like chemotaxis protein